MKPIKSTIILVLYFTLSSCVSVSLPNSSGWKSTAVELQAPSKPFELMDNKNADKAWISQKNGNTISYLSDCGSPLDPPLQQIESDTLNFLENLKIISSESRVFNGRESLETWAQGNIDGVAVKMRVLTFKKNNCSYSLVYGGVKDKFNSELGAFDQFLKGFKAP